MDFFCASRNRFNFNYNQLTVNFREIKDGTHPEPLRPFLSEIDAFSDQIHSDIINTILRYVVFFWRAILFTDENTSLIAMSLELDEDYFIQMHDRSANAETFREPYSMISFPANTYDLVRFVK